MAEIREYFVCENCSNKNFKLIYNFSLRFHTVNFSEDLIYDKLMEEQYQCTKCKKTFTREQIERGLEEIKKRMKSA